MANEVLRSAAIVAAIMVLTSSTAMAESIQTVFVIAMENHNWTQPDNQFTGTIQQVYQNPAAPFINSLVNGSSPISGQVAYAANYHAVLAAPDGSGPSIHPSEPN